MLLFLSLLTVSEVLGRGLTIEPDSFTTHGYTTQVDTWFRGVIKVGKVGSFGVTTLITPPNLIMDAYSHLAAISDPISEFCGGQPPRRQHQLPLQLSDPLACPVLLSLVNNTSHTKNTKLLSTKTLYMFLHRRFCIHHMKQVWPLSEICPLLAGTC